MPRKPKETHLRVRIGPALLARLERAREKSGRTMTGEIVARIEAAFHEQDLVSITEKVARIAADTAMDQALERLRPTPLADLGLGKPNKPEDKS